MWIGIVCSLMKAADAVVCIYARNLLAMDLCGLDGNTAKRLAGNKVFAFQSPFWIFLFLCVWFHSR